MEQNKTIQNFRFNSHLKGIYNNFFEKDPFVFRLLGISLEPA